MRIISEESIILDRSGTPLTTSGLVMETMLLQVFKEGREEEDRRREGRKRKRSGVNSDKDWDTKCWQHDRKIKGNCGLDADEEDECVVYSGNKVERSKSKRGRRGVQTILLWCGKWKK